MPAARGERSARALFAAVLHLFPASYRDEYGREMTLVLAQDIRLALRLIRRERSCATVAIGTVAIGIGLSTAVFSVGKSMLVDALPYREAERATMVWVTNPRQGRDRDVTSYPRLLAWRAHSQMIERCVRRERISLASPVVVRLKRARSGIRS